MSSPFLFSFSSICTVPWLFSGGSEGWRLALADLAGAWVVLFPAPFLVALARPEFQGSMGYVPPLLFLAGVGLYFLGRTPPLGRDLLIPTVILTVSLIFRSLDLPLCQEVLSDASGAV